MRTIALQHFQKLKIALILSGFLLIHLPIYSDTFYWDGSSGTTWNDATNWTNVTTGSNLDADGVPDDNDRVYIDTDSYTITNFPVLAGDVSVLSLNMLGATTPELNLNGHTIFVRTKSLASSIKNAQITFNGGTISTATTATTPDITHGALSFENTRFQGGNITMIGGLQFVNCVFDGASYSLTHIGDSHFNGGNQFMTAPTTITCEEIDNNGFWYWGNGAPDIFGGDLIAESFSANNKQLRLADNAGTSIFFGDVELRTRRFGSAQIANEGGNAIFKGTVRILNETQGINNDQVTRIGAKGNVVFEQGVTVEFTNDGEDEIRVEFGDTDAGSVTFQNGITLINPKNANRSVTFGDLTQKTVGKQVSITGGTIALTDFEYGELHFQNIEKTSATAINWNETAAGGAINRRFVSMFSDWTGSFTAKAGLIHLFGNTFNNLVNFTNYGVLVYNSGSDYPSSGKNTFEQDATLSLGNADYTAGDNDWVWGYNPPNSANGTGEDIFKGNLTATVQTLANRYLKLAQNASNNQFQGNVTLNALEKGTILLANDPTAFATITGELELNLNGTKPSYLASRGTLVLQGNLDLNIASTGKPKLAQYGGEIQFTGGALQQFDSDDADLDHIKKVVMNGAGGLQLNTDLRISETLDLTNGKISTNGNSLTLGFASISNENANSYINAQSGSVLIDAQGSTNRLIPVGGSAEYQPITLNHKDAGTVTFNVTMPAGKPTNATSNALANYWLVKHSTGALTADVTLGWESSPAAHYFMQGDESDWGIVAGTANFDGSTQTNLVGVTNGKLGTFGISTNTDVYAGADRTVSACANLQLNAVSGAGGTWSLVFTDGDTDPGIGNTAIFSDVNDPNTFVTTANFDAGKTYRFQWTVGADMDDVDIAVSVSGAGGAPYQVWTGTKNADWFDCNNWQGYTDATLTTTGESSVPSNSITAVIDRNHTAYTNTPSLIGATIAEAKFLTVQNKGDLDLNNHTMQVSGGLYVANFATVMNPAGGTGTILITAGTMKMTEAHFTSSTVGAMPTIIIDYQGNAYYPSFNGAIRFDVNLHLKQNSGYSDLLFGANTTYMSGGRDIFNGDLTLENNSPYELVIARNTANNTINGNVTITNTGESYVRIGDENYASSSSTLLTGGDINTSASTNGNIVLLKINYDPSLTSDPGAAGNHVFVGAGTSNVNFYLYNSVLGGNIDIQGKNVELRTTRLGAKAGTNTVNIQATTDQRRYCGGNVFYGNTTLTHLGDSSWHWGYSGGGDKFEKTLNLVNQTNNTLAYTFLADQSNSTVFGGETFMTAQGAGGIFIAEKDGSKATFKAKTHFVGARTTVQSTPDGDGVFRGFDAISVALKGTTIFEADVEATFTDAGTNISGDQVYMSFAYDSGHVQFQNLKLTDLSAAAGAANGKRRGFYIGRGNSNLKDATGAFHEQVILNGGITTNSPAEFLDGQIFLANVTQKTATAIDLTVPNAILTVYNSEFLGFVSAKAKSSSYRWNDFDGQVELSVVEANGGESASDADFSSGILNFNASYGDFACGGNNFAQNATITHSSNDLAVDWKWGDAAYGADTFALAATYRNQSDKLLLIADNSNGNLYGGNLTLENSNNGEIYMAGSNLPPTEANATVSGTVTITNTNTDATKNIKIAENGLFVFKGDMTATANTAEIQFSHGANGWIKAESTATQNLNFNTANVSVHKFEVNATNVSLANDVYFVTADNTAQLKFTSGRVKLLNSDMDLDEGQITSTNFNVHHVIAMGQGHLKRAVEATPVLFPIASDTLYYPATMTNAGVKDVLGARIASILSDKYDNSTNNNLTGNIVDSHFTSVGWVLNEETKGGTQLNLTVQWNGVGDELPDFDRNNATLHRYDFVSAAWGCGFGGTGLAGANPYTLNANYGALDELGVFAPSTPYINAGADVTFTGCDFTVLGAIVPVGTGGVGHWEFVSMTAVDATPSVPSIIHFMSAYTDITNVEEGTYTFRWVIDKPDNNHELGVTCAGLTDLVEVTITGVTGIVTGNSSDFTTWTGTTDSDWNNCDNWSAGTPGSGTAGSGTTITIPSGVPNNPNLAGNVTVKALHLDGGTINFTSAGVTLTVVEFLSADDNGQISGQKGTIKVDANSTDIAQIKNTTFNNEITLSAPNMNLNGNTFKQNTNIHKIVGGGEERWYGGNEFNKRTRINNYSSDKLLMAETVGNNFGDSNGYIDIDMTNSTTQNIYFTTAFVTTSIANNINLFGNSFEGDFFFGEGTIEISGSKDKVLRSHLDSKKMLMGSLHMNRTSPAKEIRLHRDHILWIHDHLKMTSGRIAGENGRYFKVSLRNSDPSAFIDDRSTNPIGGWVRTYANSHVSRMVDFSKAGEYHFPIGSGWHRPISVITDGTGTGIEEIIASVDFEVYALYDDANKKNTSSTKYEKEFAKSAWILTHANENYNPTGFRVQPYWNVGAQGADFNSEAATVNRYNYSTDIWECIQTARDATTPSTTWTNASHSNNEDLYFISSQVIGDEVASTSTNLGIFALSSAKANIDDTDVTQDVAEGCASIVLDARKNLESPIGGEWELVSAKGVTTGVPFDDVIIANPQSPQTVVSILNYNDPTHDGDYIFRWTRKCVEDCGSLTACGDGSALSVAYVTVAVTEDPGYVAPTAVTWTGAVSDDWNLCSNWTGAIPLDGTYSITIPEVANGRYPKVPSSVTALKSITMTEGGKLDLNGQNLTVETLEFNSAFITGFYTGAVIPEIVAEGKLAFASGTAFMTGNFISVTKDMDIRKTVFYTNIGFHYTGNNESRNGGNTFKENTAVVHKGKSRMYWGREDTGGSTSGGKDIFEKDLYAYCNACATAPGSRPTLNAPGNSRRPTLEDFSSSHDETVSYLIPDEAGKYYYPRSCTESIEDPSDPTSQSPCDATYNNISDPDNEFLAYPRKDNFDSNTGTSQDDFLASFNAQNQAANEADEKQSEANVNAAQKNVDDAYENLMGRALDDNNNVLTSPANNSPFKWMGDAKNSINGAINTANTRIGESTVIADYFANNAAAAAALAAANAISNGTSAPCDCSGTASSYAPPLTMDIMIDSMTMARDKALYGIKHRLFLKDEVTLEDQTDNNTKINSPSEDNIYANVANRAASCGLSCADKILIASNNLRAQIRLAVNAHNATIPAPPAPETNNNYLYFAYNTQGNQFQDDTRFQVELCGRIYISTQDNANADFTGDNKAHHFHNVNGYWANVIRTGLNAGTQVNFTGQNSATYIQNEGPGWMHFGGRQERTGTNGTTNCDRERGYHSWANGATLKLRNAGGRTFVGGCKNDDMADLYGSLTIDDNDLTKGQVYLSNFRQIGLGTDNYARVDNAADLFVSYKSSFDSKTELVNNGNNDADVFVAHESKAAQVVFNANLIVRHDADGININDAMDASAEFYFHRKGRVYYNGDVLVENKLNRDDLNSNTYNRRGTFFGNDDADSMSTGYLADGKKLLIGPEGFRTGSLMVAGINQSGKTKQNIWMPPYSDEYIHPESGGAQPHTRARSRLWLYDNNFEAPLHIQAITLALRDNIFQDTTYLVNYGGYESDGGNDMKSGGNRFEKKASFEFRYMTDWFDKNKNGLADATNEFEIPKNRRWYFGEDGKDEFLDELYIHNNGRNSQMALAYRTDNNVFEKKVTIINGPGPKEPNIAPDFYIGAGDAKNSVHFQSDLVIENYSNDHFHVATDNEDIKLADRRQTNLAFVSIGKPGVPSTLTIRNKIDPNYTGNGKCVDYKGGVLFGGPTGGELQIEDEVNIVIEDYHDGLLRFEKVNFKGNLAQAPIDIDLTAQVAGDLGNARLQLSFSSVHRSLEARSVWVQSDASIYDGDVSFQKTTMNGCNTAYNIEWLAKNHFKRFFRLEDIAQNDTRIILGANSPSRTIEGDIFSANAVFTVDAGAHANNRIIVSDKYLSEFAGNVALNFNTITPTSNTTFANPQDAGHYAGMKFVGKGSQTLTASHLVQTNNIYIYQDSTVSSRLFVNQNVDANLRAYFMFGKMIIGENDVFIGNSNDKNSVEVLRPGQGHIVANGKGTVNRNVYNTNRETLSPIGNLTNYLPVTLTQSGGGVDDMFRSRLLDNVYTTYAGKWDEGIDATFGGNDSFDPSDDTKYNPLSSPTPIDRNFVRRSWVVTEDVVGGTQGTLMLQWFEGSASIATDEPPGFDRQQTTIVHYKAIEDEWRCMDFISAAREDAGLGTIQRTALSLMTNADNTDDVNKMGVFSVGSLTSGENDEITTCGAGVAQLTAAPLSPPLYGTWELITVVPIAEGSADIPDPSDPTDPTFTATTFFQFQTVNGVSFITTNTGVSPGFMTAITFSSVTDANALVDGLQANMGYRFRWQNIGLSGACAIKAADILVRTGSFTSVNGEKILVWRGADEYFWDCENWYVQGNPTDYSLPSTSMRLLIPEKDAVTGKFVGTPVSGDIFYPVLYDRVPLTVKSIQIQNGGSFDLGGSAAESTNPSLSSSDDKYSDVTNYDNKNEFNGNTRLTVSEFISVEVGGRFGNHYETVVEGDVVNYGTFENELLFYTGAGGITDIQKTTPILRVKGDFYNLDTLGQEPAFSTVTELSQIEFSGSLFNEGSMFHTAGDVFFISGTSFISGGSDISLNRVTLNKDADADSLVIAKTKVQIIESGDMTFTKGKTFTYSNYGTSPYAPSLLSFDKNATATSVANPAGTFVRGPVSKYLEAGVNPDFEYPIGKGDRWARAGILNVTGGSADFVTAEYFDTPFAFVGNAFISSTTARPLRHVSLIEHWMLDPSNSTNGQAARVRLFWENGTFSGIGGLTWDADPYLSNLVVAHFLDASGNGTYGAGDHWRNEGGRDEQTPASEIAKGAVTSHNTQLISSFSPFTFGSDEDINPLPVEWLYVRAKLITNGQETLVQWGTASEIDNDYFEVLRSQDGKNFTVIGIVDAGTNSHGKDYSFIDENPFEGVTYYQIRQVDYDGTSSQTRIVSVNRVPEISKPWLTLFPNPTNHQDINLRIQSDRQGKTTLRIFNAIGEQVLTMTVDLTEGLNELNLRSLPYMSAGVYVVSVDELFLRSKLIIE